jgi:hypothetical protein
MLSIYALAGLSIKACEARYGGFGVHRQCFDDLVHQLATQDLVPHAQGRKPAGVAVQQISAGIQVLADDFAQGVAALQPGDLAGHALGQRLRGQGRDYRRP